MESFKDYMAEKDNPKNYILKKDLEDNFVLLDSEGKEIKKSASKKELEKYAKEHDYELMYFNEDSM